MSALHFLRPEWLWLLLGIPVLGWIWWKRQPNQDPWTGVVDPALRPYVLEDNAERPRAWLGLLWASLFAALLVLALAGPAWKKRPQTLVQTRTPLVIAMDLSQRSLQADLPPSRLIRMRAKVAQLLQARAGAQVALVVFAGTAHAVTPLTDDPANIEVFLPDLQPAIMPEGGQSPAAALRLARKMLRDNGYNTGDIVLLTDSADADAIKEAAVAHAQGYDVSALGVNATSSGLRSVAQSGGGGYAAMAVGPSDIAELGLNVAKDADTAATKAKGAATWEDGGWILLPLLLLLLLPMFRRGAVALVLVLGFFSSLSPSAQAADVWRRKDQVEYAQMKQGNDAYRQGRYEDAIKAYSKVDTAEGHYNLANALAKSGKYQEALKAYDRSLQMQANNADAIANRETVARAAKRKPPQGNNHRQNQSQPQQQGNQQQQQQGNQQQQQQQQSSGDQTPSSASPSQAQPGAEPNTAADPKAQAEADAAQKARMAAARNAQQNGQDKKATQTRAETPAERAARQRSAPVLKRIPDDPGTLLQRKFLLEYRAGKGR
jgi:Ca-activated chloride channel family protein